MKSKLPIFTIVGILFCVAGTLVQGQPVQSGDQLVNRAARAVFQQKSISAKIRQTVNMFGHQLVGSGAYLQLGEGTDKLMRLELKIQVGDRVTSLQQVSDGRFLWIRRNLPSGVVLSRIDLRRIRKALREQQRSPRVDANSTWMALGGLSKLISNLAANFQFSAPQPSQLGDVPIWVVHGQWRPEKLAKMLSEKKGAKKTGESIRLDELPEHLPHRVTLVLGRDESLFPYRVEYFRQPAEDAAEKDDSSSSLLTMELFEVRLGAAIDPLQFVYKPDDLEVADHTDLYLKSLGLNKP